MGSSAIRHMPLAISLLPDDPCFLLTAFCCMLFAICHLLYAICYGLNSLQTSIKSSAKLQAQVPVTYIDELLQDLALGFLSRQSDLPSQSLAKNPLCKFVPTMIS